MATGTQTYRQYEKLKGRKIAASLFSKGQSFNIFPLRCTYEIITAAEDFCLHAGVGANKRLFKKATQRNAVKRVLREAWRKEKHVLLTALQTSGKQLNVFIHCIDKQIPDAEIVQNKMQVVIKKLVENIHEDAV